MFKERKELIETLLKSQEDFDKLALNSKDFKEKQHEMIKSKNQSIQNLKDTNIRLEEEITLVLKE